MHVEAVSQIPRTELELKNELRPIDFNIGKEIKSRLTWGSSIIGTSKKSFNVTKNPAGSIFKVVFLVFAGYISYLLIRGIFAGIEVDFDNNFLDLFSTNVTVRLNAGLNLTNGDQAGQFLIDLALMWYGVYRIFIKKPYNKYYCETINNIYNEQITEFLSANKREEADFFISRFKESAYEI